MGSSSSKQHGIGSNGAAARAGSSYSLSSSVAGGSRRRQSKAWRMFSSSCLGSSSQIYDSDDDYQGSDHDGEECGALDYGSQIHQTESEASEVKIECYQNVKLDQPDELPSIPSNSETRDRDHRVRANDVHGSTRSSGNLNRVSSGQTLNRSSRFLSHFSFVPTNVGFRLNRATSVGSGSRMAYPVSPASITINNDSEEQAAPPLSLTDRNENGQRSDSHAQCLSNPPCGIGDTYSRNLHINHPSNLPTSSLSYQVNPSQDLDRDRSTDRNRSGICLLSPRYHNEARYADARPVERRNGTQDPADRNIQFSRTLSVGRLRDRVIRRPSFADLTYSPLHVDSIESDSNRSNQIPAAMGEMMTAASDENILNSATPSGFSPSSVSSPMTGRRSRNFETSRQREAGYHDLLEHRSNFLERRRRIRSQVRALQQMGSRFDNSSGHGRSCVLLGQHRTGRCTCRVNRDSYSSDSGARASISRVVMLAEALFEVLDEIHQQSVVLSSQPSISPIGSVPAPIEFVEALPVKVYSKSTKTNEEVAQCYICLVEYEEGDGMRTLPCHHEFHQTCIDKWLKEIHRVCPLCRGDICSSVSSAAEI